MLSIPGRGWEANAMVGLKMEGIVGVSVDLKGKVFTKEFKYRVS